jgi:hypothetical protein
MGEFVTEFILQQSFLRPTNARSSILFLNSPIHSLFVSLVYCAESTVCWFVVREKHCWMAADCADKSKRTGRQFVANSTLRNGSVSKLLQFRAQATRSGYSKAIL